MMLNSPIPLGIFSWVYFVDKIVIAIVLLVVGMAVTLLLLRDHARVAYKNELEEHRVLNLAEVWTALYEFNSRSDELIDQMAEVVVSGESEESKDRLRRSETRSRESAERLNDLAGEYQFWLSKSGYSDVMELYNLLMDRMNFLAEGDLNGMRRVRQRIEERLPTIDGFFRSP